MPVTTVEQDPANLKPGDFDKPPGKTAPVLLHERLRE
jgi:hypothetical protein